MLELMKSLLPNGNALFLIAVFGSVVFFTIAVSSLTSTWFSVRRRAAASSVTGSSISGYGRDNIFDAQTSNRTAERLWKRNNNSSSGLRRFLNLAGYYGASAPAVYQICKIVSGLFLGLLTPLWINRFMPNLPFAVSILGGALTGMMGYMLPRSIVGIQRDKLLSEHRAGFPDLLDLLVICVEAGIGVDSAIERVSWDLERVYPSLARNLQFMTLEMRAGQSTREALGNLAERLGIQEAKSFATLIQQSEELGSSLVQSLRVYSEEMRSKRLARAEEKAYALPAKLVIPLGLFVFPVILGVTLFPVALRVLKVFSN